VRPGGDRAESPMLESITLSPFYSRHKYAGECCKWSAMQFLAGLAIAIGQNLRHLRDFKLDSATPT